MAALARRYGYRHLEAVEDAVGEALLRATQLWEEKGVPREPAAWLRRVAERILIDELRRGAGYRDRVLPRLAGEAAARGAEAAPGVDDELGLLFACCRPELPVEGRVALALRTVFSFSVGEISSLMFTPYETTQKRLYRVRERFRSGALDPVLQAPEESRSGDFSSSLRSAPAVWSVLLTLYLVFTRAYRRSVSPTRTDAPAGIDLGADVLSRLDALLASSTLRDPDSRGAACALTALVLFHLARLEGRSGVPLVPLPLADRSTWNADLLRAGADRLDEARVARRLSRYHVEAAIAAEYSLAPSWEAVDWNAVFSQYEIMERFGPSRRGRIGRSIAASYAATSSQDRRRAYEDLSAATAGGGMAGDLQVQLALAVLAGRAGDEGARKRALEAATATASGDAELELVRRVSSRGA